jgi:hypothetical protein
MTKPRPKRMPDCPRWFTPPGPRVRASAAYLDSQPIGTVLDVPVPFGDDDEPVSLSVVKVSSTKWGVHTKAGFPARKLVGARVKRRQRRDGSESRAESAPRDAMPGPVQEATARARASFAAAVARMAPNSRREGATAQ